MLTTSYVEYLKKNDTGEKWTLLYPFMWLLGPFITLTLDYFKYVFDKSVPEDQPEWYPPTRRDWQKPIFYAFKPLGELFKSFHDTFKPFKYGARFEAIRILKQPVDNSAEALSGVIRTIAIPIITTGLVFFDLCRLCGKPNSYKNVFENISENLVRGLAGTVNGALRIVNGTLRLAATPVSWLIKPIIRLGVCLMLFQSGGEMPLIETNDGIQSRAEIAKNQTDEAVIKTCADIHRKFKKCLNRLENTCININTEEKNYQNLSASKNDPNLFKTATATYLNLFSKKPVVVEVDVHAGTHLLMSSGSAYT
jgi:hypothetical protein